MAHPDDEFIRQGLVHYKEAALAVRQFKDVMVNRLTAGLEHQWLSGEPASPPYEHLTEGESYIECYRRVSLRPRVRAMIALGIGWESDSSYLYAYCAEGPDWARHLKGSQIDPWPRYDVLWTNFDGIKRRIDVAIDGLLRDFVTRIKRAERVRTRQREVDPLVTP